MPLAGELDERAAELRADMVGSLRAAGISDERVLQAMAELPRHQFLDRLYARLAAGEEMTWHDVTRESLPFVYHADRASVTRLSPEGAATASVSAPIIVALMLEEARLSAGLRVLEIGAGSGYYAALVAGLVGDPSLVTTIDIDESLIAETTVRLRSLGLGEMTVLCSDGALGFPLNAPYDRIIATVGCKDLSPAWLAQLAPDGELVLPLWHAGSTPRVRLSLVDGCAVGGYLGHSGFVAIQGVQDLPRFGPSSSYLGSASRRRRAASSDWSDSSGTSATIRFGPPELSLYLAHRDPRSRSGLLYEGASAAGFDDQGCPTGIGPDGPVLVARLQVLVADWKALGRPGLDRYRLSFAPIPARPPLPDSAAGPWQLDRIDFRQTTTLLPA